MSVPTALAETLAEAGWLARRFAAVPNDDGKVWVERMRRMEMGGRAMAGFM